MPTAADIGTTRNTADMTRTDWANLLGAIVTFLVEDSLGCFSHYTGTVSTIREGVGEVVLADLTRTRLTGAFAGESRTIARRLIPLCKVRTIAWLNF